MCDQAALSDEVKMALRESSDRFASRLFTTSSAPPASQAASSRSILTRSEQLPDTHFKRVIGDQIRLEHRFHHIANAIPECSVIKAGLVLSFGPPYQVDRWIDGKFRRDCIQTGDFTVFPEGVAYRVAWDRPVELLMLGFDRSLIEQTVLAFNQDERQRIPTSYNLEVLPLHKLNDPLIYQIGLALKTALQTDGAIERLYTESMLNALLVHLLRCYASESYLAPRSITGLSNAKLKQVIEYIQAHLSQDISLAELAAIAQMGARHFSRCFKQSTGLSPYQYLIKCRVDRAKELLQQKNSSIVETAQAVGFANQSHLTRHFKRWLGVSPRSVQQR
jgi:AraC family transcriptional regulator